ncbi:hypothetical protein RCL1_007315 [Eukaryota sp. TZLM3-RCL]
MYNCRTIPYGNTILGLNIWSNYYSDFLLENLGFLKFPDLVYLPLKFGGLGINNLSAICHIAYSVSLFYEVKDLKLSDYLFENQMNFLHSTLSQSFVGEESFFDSKPDQRSLTSLLYKTKLNELVGNMTEAEKKHLNSNQLSASLKFLQVIPSNSDVVFSDSQLEL